MSTEGKKNDMGKPRFDLVDPYFTESIAKVLTFGASKYGPNNWQKVDKPIERYYAALQRHLNAFWAGEIVDDASGLTHLAHAATNIMFLMHFIKQRPPEDKKAEQKSEDDEMQALLTELYQTMIDAILRKDYKWI